MEDQLTEELETDVETTEEETTMESLADDFFKGGETEETSEDTETEETKQAEEAKKEAETEAKKEDDEDDLTKEPEGLSENASKRFQALSNKNKELNTRYQQLEQNYNDVKSVITESVNSQEEFVQLMDFAKAQREGRYDDAMQMLQQQAQQLSRLTGKTFEADPLPPELRARVNAFEIDESDAMQIVQADQLKQQQLQAQQTQQQEQQQQAQYQQQIDAMSKSVEEMETQWKATDPDAEYKLGEVAKHIDQIKQDFPDPSLWASAIKMKYESIRKPATRTPLPISKGKVTDKATVEPTNYNELASQIL